jgi:hypothetical protein
MARLRRLAAPSHPHPEFTLNQHSPDPVIPNGESGWNPDMAALLPISNDRRGAAPLGAIQVGSEVLRFVQRLRARAKFAGSL